jgi:hypothetical protein
MGLQGWDASAHYRSSRDRLGDGWPDTNYYVSDTPHYMGQFPALAIAVHRGYIRQGGLVAARRVTEAALFAGVDPLCQDFGAGEDDAKDLRGELETPKWALAAGRVTCKLGAAAGAEKSILSGWSALQDRAAKTIRSTTNELEWDYGRGVVRVRAPKVEAVIGFAGGATHELSSLSADITTRFVSLIVVPLDDLPIAESRRMLLSAMARDTQTDAVYSESRDELLEIGRPPLLMEPVAARLRFRGAPVRELRPLDIYGVPKGEGVHIAHGEVVIDGRYATYQYELRR